MMILHIDAGINKFLTLRMTDSDINFKDGFGAGGEDVEGHCDVDCLVRNH